MAAPCHDLYANYFENTRCSRPTFLALLDYSATAADTFTAHKADLGSPALDQTATNFLTALMCGAWGMWGARALRRCAGLSEVSLQLFMKQRGLARGRVVA